MGDHVIRIDDLDVVRHLDVRRRDRAFAFLAQHQRDLVAVVQLEHDALQVQQDVDHVFVDAVDRRVLVHHAGDLRLGRRVPDHRRQQHAAQRVAERVAVAALERFQRDTAAFGPMASTSIAWGFSSAVLVICVYPFNTLGSLHR